MRSSEQQRVYALSLRNRADLLSELEKTINHSSVSGRLIKGEGSWVEPRWVLANIQAQVPRDRYLK